MSLDCPRLDDATLEALLVAITKARSPDGRLIRLDPELVLRQNVLDQLPEFPARIKGEPR